MDDQVAHTTFIIQLNLHSHIKYWAAFLLVGYVAHQLSLSIKQYQLGHDSEI